MGLGTVGLGIVGLGTVGLGTEGLKTERKIERLLVRSIVLYYTAIL